MLCEGVDDIIKTTEDETAYRLKWYYEGGKEYMFLMCVECMTMTMMCVYRGKGLTLSFLRKRRATAFPQGNLTDIFAIEAGSSSVDRQANAIGRWLLLIVLVVIELWRRSNVLFVKMHLYNR